MAPRQITCYLDHNLLVQHEHNCIKDIEKAKGGDYDARAHCSSITNVNKENHCNDQVLPIHFRCGHFKGKTQCIHIVNNQLTITTLPVFIR